MTKKLAKRSLYKQVDKEPARYPYGARVSFSLAPDSKLEIAGPVCLAIAPNAIIELKPLPDQPSHPLENLKRYTAKIEGFSTASEAESVGLQLSLSLLWAAISRKFTMRLDYHTPLPCVVYDRTISTGITSSGFAQLTLREEVDGFAKLMKEALTPESVDRQLLLSMELFAAARLETSDRAKFISLISSLEPLATRREHPASIRTVVHAFREQLKNVEITELSEDTSTRLKTSLDHRLQELEHESIRQGLLRTVREALPEDPDAALTIDNAYALRSKMIHQGARDPYLDRTTNKVQEIIRRIYAAHIGKPLKTPATY